MARNVLELIGNTPVVRINRMNPNPKVTIYAKLEGFNPGGSVKDRIAKYMIEKAEETGELTKDKIIVEATSGNTGIGLAIVGRIKGYRVQIVMPESMSIERRKVLRAYGVELILTPGEAGVSGAYEEARRLAKDPRYFMPDQFANPNNVLAHYETTGKEILEQVGQVDVFVAGIGTSGTIMGAGKRLRESNPRVKIIGVEPYRKSKIQGLKCLGEGFIPAIFNSEMIDDIAKVTDEDAFATARRLAKEEGLFVGMSSGAAMFEAMRQAEMMDDGVLVVIFPDCGEKYLSTELFEV
ncbi:MAG: cysteine synthase family protein [Actinomycetota bacterium]|nr:cysteine synthase family protein [Actinomycetota bacterium]MDI6821363.1 cysteine synthase family protein [Actinomycetota bacterium]